MLTQRGQKTTRTDTRTPAHQAIKDDKVRTKSKNAGKDNIQSLSCHTPAMRLHRWHPRLEGAAPAAHDGVAVVGRSKREFPADMEVLAIYTGFMWPIMLAQPSNNHHTRSRGAAAARTWLHRVAATATYLCPRRGDGADLASLMEVRV